MSGTRRTIMQDMQIYKRTEKMATSVSAVECYVCGKGLQDGLGISAKTLPSGTVLFCDDHYSLQ